MNLRGWVDLIGPSGVYGWAIDDDDGSSPVLVDILKNGELLATISAEKFRPDLVAVGRAGHCAFAHSNPTIEPCDLEVRFHASMERLPNGFGSISGASFASQPNGPGPVIPNPWNADQPRSAASTWLSAQSYLQHLNQQTSNDPSVHWFDYVITKYILPSAADSILLLGSSEGWMQRRLCERGFHGRIVATDIAEKALARARARAAAAGLDNIVHVQADLNKDRFSEKFDFIIAEGVLHHIEQIDHCLDRLKANLKPGGLLIGIEYKGPYRFQLPDQHVRWINAALGLMPGALRCDGADHDPFLPLNPEAQAAAQYRPPSIDAMLRLDPSEAVSGFKLPELLHSKFTLVEEKQVGGSLIMYLDGHFPFEKANHDPFSNAWLQVLIAIESALNTTGILPYENFFFVARAAPETVAVGQ